MIYDPRMIFSLRAAVGLGIVQAIFQLAQDFIAGDNKPWSYYLGVAMGGTALATGGVGAAATMYAVGQSVDLLFFHSEEGSLVDVYLDGILATTIDTFNPIPNWVSASVVMTEGVMHRLEVVNRANPNPEKTSPVNWLALGPVTINAGYKANIQGAAMNLISFRLVDAEQNSAPASFPINVPSGLAMADYQAWVDSFAPKLDAATGSKITGVEMTITLDLPGGLKADPVANHINERGGLITFSTTGPRAESVRIPAIKSTIMPGDTFDLAQLASLITSLTNVTAGTIRPVTPNGYQFAEARRGVKSFRK